MQVNDTPPRTALVVLGMHRSGTSFLARTLAMLGADLPGTPIGASENNLEGYAESRAVQEFDDRLLASAGSAWDDWRDIEPGWFASPKAPEFAEEARAILRSEFGTSGLFVLKDPRICRLVPFWTAVLREEGIAPMPILTLRNPLEVSASLGARNDMPDEIAQLVWLRHVLDAESATRGMTRAFTSYDRMLSGWGRESVKIAERLGLSWPRSPARLAQDGHQAARAELRHHSFDADALKADPKVWDGAARAHAILSDWAAKGEPAATGPGGGRKGRRGDFAALDAIRAELDAAGPVFGPVVAQSRRARMDRDAAIRRADKIETKAAKSRERLREEAKEKRAELEARIADLRRELADAGDKRATLREENREKHARLEGRISALGEELAEANRKRGALREENREKHAALEARIAALGEELAEAGRKRAHLREEAKEKHAGLEARIGTLQEELDEARGERETLSARAETAESALAQRRAEVDDLRGALEQMEREREAEANALRETIARLEGERDARASAAADMRQALDRAMSELRKETGRAAGLSDKLRKEEAKGAKRTSELAQLSLLLQQAEARAGVVSARAEADDVVRRQEADGARIRVALAGVRRRRWPGGRARALNVLRATGLFDADWYLRANEDVAGSGMAPEAHYLDYGLAEGRPPNSGGAAMPEPRPPTSDQTASGQTEPGQTEPGSDGDAGTPGAATKT